MRRLEGLDEHGVIITIYDHAVPNAKKSEKTGVPMFDTRLYISKKVPNSRDLYDQPVKSTDRDRYPDLFQRFDMGQEPSKEGTPIEQWAEIDVSQVASLKAASIFTLQALSKISDSGLHRLPPDCRNLKPKAQKRLDQMRENETLQKETDKLKKETVEQAKEIDQLRKLSAKQLKDMASMVESIEALEKKVA